MNLRVRAPEERTPTASLSQAREWQQLETHKQMLLRSIRQRLASLAGSEDIEAVRGALTMFEPVPRILNKGEGYPRIQDTARAIQDTFYM